MIYLSAGHNETARGACFDGFCEHEEAVRWVDLILAGMGKMHGKIIPGGTVKQKVGYVNEHPPTAWVEVHFNSALSKDVSAGGYLTMYQPNSQRSKDLSHAMHKAVGVSAGRDRGQYVGYYRLNEAFGLVFILRDSLCPAVIIEPEFIHNVKEIAAMREQCCEDIAKALVVFDLTMQEEEW